LKTNAQPLEPKVTGFRFPGHADSLRGPDQTWGCVALELAKGDQYDKSTRETDFPMFLHMKTNLAL